MRGGERGKAESSTRTTRGHCVPPPVTHLRLSVALAYLSHGNSNLTEIHGEVRSSVTDNSQQALNTDLIPYQYGGTTSYAWGAQGPHWLGDLFGNFDGEVSVQFCRHNEQMLITFKSEHAPLRQP